MKYVSLDNLALISAGGTPPRGKSEYWNGSIPWIKISDISSKYVTSCEENISELGLENSNAKVFPKGTILYTIFATLGRVGILNIDAATNQAIAGIQVYSKDVNLDYLYFYLKSQEKRVNQIGKGVAQKNINLSILRNWPVPVPSIEDQAIVMRELDSISSLIESRKQSVSILDEQVKSLFNARRAVA